MSYSCPTFISLSYSCLDHIWLIHFLSMFNLCLIPVLLSYLYLFHVLTMAYSCFIHVFFMSYPCLIHVIFMAYSCLIHVLFISYIWLIHVLSMFNLCLTPVLLSNLYLIHVLTISYSYFLHVLSMSYPCLIHVIFSSCSCHLRVWWAVSRVNESCRIGTGEKWRATQLKWNCRSLMPNTILALTWVAEYDHTDKMIGLFCKRAVYKRRYSAK